MSDTSPFDPARLRHNAPKDLPRVAQPGELLFEFLRGHDLVRVELPDHGPFGVEAQILVNGEFRYGRRFDARLDLSPREVAIRLGHRGAEGDRAPALTGCIQRLVDNHQGAWCPISSVGDDRRPSTAR